jgi:hypothetical protein
MVQIKNNTSLVDSISLMKYTLLLISELIAFFVSTIVFIFSIITKGFLKKVLANILPIVK